MILEIASGFARYCAFISLHWFPITSGLRHGFTLSYQVCVCTCLSVVDIDGYR